jgi:hypothetical protein
MSLAGRGPSWSDRTLAILCPGVWSVRNVVHAGVADRLRAGGSPPRLIIAPAPTGEQWDVGPDALTSPLLEAPVSRPLRGKPSLEAILRASFARRHAVASYAIFSRWIRREETAWQRVRNTAAELCAIPGSRSPLYEWQIAFLERFNRATRDHTAVRRQLEELRPALLVSTYCVDGAEMPYLRSARELGVPVVGWIMSFDNLTSRTILPRFDYYMVWNERMRAQVLRLYPGLHPDRVHITGTPQFDFHVQPALRWARARTLAALDLPADTRYLLYAANSTWLTPTEPDLLDGLLQRLATVPALQDHHVVVRLHPLDDFSRWEPLRTRSPRLRIVRPWSAGGRAGNAEDQARLVSTLLHADACLNIVSTMSLDAAVVDTPVVCIAFSAHADTVEDRFARECYRTEHYRPIVESGGVRVAASMDDLVRELVAYAGDRGRDARARADLVASECGPVDGRSAQRVAACLRSLLAEAARRRASSGRRSS